MFPSLPRSSLIMQDPVLLNVASSASCELSLFVVLCMVLTFRDLFTDWFPSPCPRSEAWRYFE